MSLPNTSIPDNAADVDLEEVDDDECLIASDVAVIPSWVDRLASAASSFTMSPFAAENDDCMEHIAGVVLAIQKYAELIGLPCRPGRHPISHEPALLMGDVAVDHRGAQAIRSASDYEPLELLAVEEVYIEWGRQVIAQAIEEANESLAWPQRLRDNREIADYMSENSSHEIDDEMVRDHFHGMQAVLVKIPTLKVSVNPASADNNMVDEKNEKRFLKLPAKTVPPVILNESGILEDGHHRQRVALKRGDPWMWAYLPVHEDIDLKPYFGKPEKNAASRSPW